MIGKAIVIVLLTGLSVCANYFPVRQGNWWLFTYTFGFTHLGGGWRDSGTVLWQIDHVEPGNITTRIYITKTIAITKEHNFSSVHHTQQDTVFSPPQTTVTVETLVTRVGDPRIYYDGDSCPILAFNPESLSVSAATCSTRNVWYKEDSIPAIKIDPVPCRPIRCDRDRFLSILERNLSRAGCLCYAWALMPNYFHLL